MTRAAWRKINDWTRAMMSALSFTAWERGSIVKRRLVAKNPGKQADE